MDRTALLLYYSRVEQKSLDNARAAHDGASMVMEGGLVDEQHLLRRATLLDGLAEDFRDDLRILRHPLLIGRWCVAGARVLLAIARALR
jgi:hypothetical protein